MTKIEAYIRTQMLQEVQDALDLLEIAGLTVIDVRGRGRSRGVTHTYRGSQYTLRLGPHLKLEVIVKDDQVQEVIAAIQKAAYTGEVGDGAIIASPLSEVVRIRTGERGDLAMD